MLFLLFQNYPNVMMACGAVFTFALTAFMINRFKDRLPADEGREFAVEGKLSKGKPRGAGLIFVLCFILGILLFGSIFLMSPSYGCELGIYLVLVFLEMLTGYLDDKAEKPWGRVKKGLLDFCVSIIMAGTYVFFNGPTIYIGEDVISLPIWLIVVLIVAMCWFMINATNCADGVDGLSASLVLITLAGFMVADYSFGRLHGYRFVVVYFAAALLGYLLFNAGPSILMMGDAGSRAMGIFICVIALRSGHPLLVIPFAFVIIMDGGLGLFKVTMIKLTKKKDFMNKIRTPLHDHVRKNFENGWSNNQCVTRFDIIQLVITIATIYLFCR